ncbi:hypothetical protein SLEP1_g965 [Rubroshorea leprosula]|uniref:Uncharacterized protein n=1 Tax=Rubroshorea leprosula TaxID=152421 RepID=A0AAV5HGY9_9ROSI|nr:hypothetical protein SLEP1_g965 [Rubroshorea leprosula]
MVAGHMWDTVEFVAVGEGDSAGTSSADGINGYGPERTAEMRFGRMGRVNPGALDCAMGTADSSMWTVSHVDAIGWKEHSHVDCVWWVPKLIGYNQFTRLYNQLYTWE